MTMLTNDTFTTLSNSVSYAGTKDLVAYCQTLGLAEHPIVSAIDGHKHQKNIAQVRIDEADLIALWQLLASSDTQGIGLRLGQKIAPESKGLLASWISQACTLEDALSIFREHIQLMNPSECWSLSTQKDQVSLRFNLDSSRGYPSIAIERSMSAMLAWARALSGKAFPLLNACFSFPEPPYRALFEDIFGQHLQFNCSDNQLVFSKALLTTPILSGNQFLCDVMEERAIEMTRQLAQAQPVVEKAKLLIKQAIKNGSPLSVGELSDALAVSRQTLYRRLKEHDTDFKTLLDETRKDQAVRMLDKGSKIQLISLSLGYKDSSSFYKAFHRWFGCAPKAYNSLFDKSVNNLRIGSKDN
jgi:AraC-like DNA-binding protein